MYNVDVVYVIVRELRAQVPHAPRRGVADVGGARRHAGRARGAGARRAAAGAARGPARARAGLQHHADAAAPRRARAQGRALGAARRAARRARAARGARALRAPAPAAPRGARVRRPAVAGAVARGARAPPARRGAHAARPPARAARGLPQAAGTHSFYCIATSWRLLLTHELFFTSHIYFIYPYPLTTGRRTQTSRGRSTKEYSGDATKATRVQREDEERVAVRRHAGGEQVQGRARTTPRRVRVRLARQRERRRRAQGRGVSYATS